MANNDAINEFIKRGGRITKCPTINSHKDRARAARNRPPVKEKPEEPKVQPLSEVTCARCQQENGKSDKRCLRCAHYKQFQKQYDLREQIVFDHLPEALLEQIADTPRPDLIERIRSLPLNKSVPLMMQYYLNASPDEIADHLQITRQAVARKNKLTLVELRSLVEK